MEHRERVENMIMSAEKKRGKMWKEKNCRSLISLLWVKLIENDVFYHQKTEAHSRDEQKTKLYWKAVVKCLSLIYIDVIYNF